MKGMIIRYVDVKVEEEKQKKANEKATKKNKEVKKNA